MKLPISRLALLVLLLCTSCSTIAERSLSPVSSPLDALEPPGFFDIGAGFGVVFDTRNSSDDDASGTLLNFKAYPLGRWYGEPRADLVSKGLTDRDKADMKTVLGADENDRTTKLGNLANDAALASAVDRLKAVLEDRSVQLSEDAAKALKAALDGSKALAPGDRKLLTQVASSTTTSRKWRVVQERDRFLNRFSVFYGTSAGHFSGGGLESDVNVFGVGLDVSPDLSLLFGRAFYDVDDGGGEDSDNSWFFGASLNLFAFKDFVAKLSGLGGD